MPTRTGIRDEREHSFSPFQLHIEKSNYGVYNNRTWK